LIYLLWRVSQVCISSFRSIDGRNGRWDFSLGTNHFEILLMAFFHEVLCPSTKAFFHFYFFFVRLTVILWKWMLWCIMNSWSALKQLNVAKNGGQSQ
jgi:hypothetical protein